MSTNLSFTRKQVNTLIQYVLKEKDYLLDPEVLPMYADELDCVIDSMEEELDNNEASDSVVEFLKIFHFFIKIKR